MALLEPVNALADASPGFVWRLETEDGNATAVRGFDDDRLIVNSLPTVAEAEERLEQLREHGPTPFAFSFKSRFAPIDEELGCPA